MRTIQKVHCEFVDVVNDLKTQGVIVAAALAERDASRSRDGDNSHGSGTGERRQVPTQRECTYT
ncbi:hypothetical protein Tco_0207163, partial [Tanacetum coccineum]